MPPGVRGRLAFCIIDYIGDEWFPDSDRGGAVWGCTFEELGEMVDSALSGVLFVAEGVDEIAEVATDAVTTIAGGLWKLPSRTVGYSLGTLSMSFGGSHKRLIFWDNQCRRREVDLYVGGIMCSAWGMTPSDSTIFLGSDFFKALLKKEQSDNAKKAWPVLAHECGHTIQAEALGPFYLPLVVPFTGWSYNLDYFNWAESWADRLGEDRISFPEEWLLE